jgi:ankyrin repeat protein
MLRHLFSAPVLYFTIILLLPACKGASGGKEKEERTWHMTDDVAHLQPGPEDEDAFRQAALDGEFERVKGLVKKGVDCNVTDQAGSTALMLAAFNGHSEIVQFLIESGAAVDQRDYLDRTALLYGATGPFPETVKILLDHGADPNKVDSEEHFSPLMHAAAEGNLEVVKVLIKYGADRNLKDADGDDAGTFATQNGHLQVVEYLKRIV